MFATIPELAVPERMVGQLARVLADDAAAVAELVVAVCRPWPVSGPTDLPPIYAGNVTAICGSVL